MALYLLTAPRHLVSLGLRGVIREGCFPEHPKTKDRRAIRDLWYLNYRNYFYSVWLVEPSLYQITRKLEFPVLNIGTKPQRKAMLYGGYIYAASDDA